MKMISQGIVIVGLLSMFIGVWAEVDTGLLVLLSTFIIVNMMAAK